MDEKQKKFFNETYASLSGIPIGRPIFDGEKILNCEVRIPVESLTRHGLVSGSTGTGKSRVIQLIIEQLSERKIPVFLSDIKGDMSGFCLPGKEEAISLRAENLGYRTVPRAYSTRYWGNGEGLTRFRINLSDIDFIILAKLLELNPTQESHLGSLYAFAKEKNITIRDLGDVRDIVSYCMRYPEKNIGSSRSSLGVIYRKIKTLELNALDTFFGMPSFDVQDLLSGKMIQVLWLQNYQKEKYNTGNLVSFLLYTIYNTLPETGDMKVPKLILCIDEAHQIFDNANEKLVDCMVSILKQIRSKGVGIIFNTQNAEDIPEKILEQLGLKIQFSLRAFSQKELQDIRGAMNSFPESSIYNLREEVKSMENGTAFVSVINEAGSLLPPIKTAIYPPSSFLDAPSPSDIARLGNKDLIEKYLKTGQRNPIELGSPLDAVSVSRGGKWDITQFVQRKEEERSNRMQRRKRKDMRKFLVLLVALSGIIAFIFFLYLILRVLDRSGD